MRPAWLAAAVTLALYAVTLGGTYVYDDRPIVVNDPRVRHPDRWGQLWTGDYFNGGLDHLYRPLTSSSYAVEWAIHGDRPWAFHLTNVLLAAAAAAGVAAVVSRAANPPAAYAAGLIFAAHPVHAEAVANIVGRAELACTLALLGSIGMLLRRPLTTARATAVVAAGVAAALCKEQGLLAPALWVAAVALLWRHRPTACERAVLKAAAAVVVWLWAAGLLARQHWLRFDWDRGLLDRAMQPMVTSTGVDRLLLPVSLLGRYAVLLVWPAHLSPDYGGDVIGPRWHAADPYAWAGVAVIAGWVVAVVACLRKSRRRRFALFCLVSIAVTYAVVGNLVTVIGTIFNERLIYLPSAFAAMLAGLILARLSTRTLAFVLAVMLVPMGVCTARSAAEWNHPRTLFTRALTERPGSIQLHLLLAEADHDAGDEAGRRDVLADACRRFPDYWRCWADAARAAADAGDFAAAHADLRYATDHAFNPALMAARSYVDDRERALTRRPTSRPGG